MSKEMHAVLLDILKTAAGFFLALLLNSMVGRWRDGKAFRGMLRAVNSEAEANHAILTESFLKFFKEGLVLRQFTIETTSQYLTNPLFLEHAKPALLQALHRHVRNLKLANAYREKCEKLRLEKGVSDWLDTLVELWERNLEACAADIKFARYAGYTPNEKNVKPEGAKSLATPPSAAA